MGARSIRPVEVRRSAPEASQAQLRPLRKRAMSARLRLALCLLAASAALVFTGDSQALAGTVHCGDTITQDTTLEADLVCPGDGLVIGSGNVTLNLAGH